MARRLPTLPQDGGVGAHGPRWLKEHVAAVTAVLTLMGYALVAATFEGWIPFYPDVSEAGVDLLGHAIAVVNAAATICLLAGWYWIRRGRERAHARAMTAAFGLIVLFLCLYLPKVGGGGQKYLADAAPDLVATAYVVMLLVHVALSALAMPVVIYAFLLGVTHAPTELYDTNHARVGRIAAGSWILSLVLGVLTYVLLAHVYGSDFVPA